MIAGFQSHKQRRAVRRWAGGVKGVDFGVRPTHFLVPAIGDELQFLINYNSADHWVRFNKPFAPPRDG